MAEIDVIVPTAYRPGLLKRCLESLSAAAKGEASRLSLRILVGVGAEDSTSIACLEQLRRENPELNIEIHLAPQRLLPPAARNRLLPSLRGDWVFFIDDDAYVPDDFFSRFAQACASSPDADVIGGPNLTPQSSSRFQHACGAAMASRFGASSSAARYAPRTPGARACGEESLILCNLFFKRSVLNGVRFPESLICNEENWVLQDLSKVGHRLVYFPELFVWHERRKSLEQFFIQIHRYGIGRGQNLRRRPWTTQYFHLVPAFSLLFTAACFSLAARFPLLIWLWLFLLATYIMLWIFASTRLHLRGERNALVDFLSALLFPLIHISYGLGVLRGLVVLGA